MLSKHAAQYVAHLAELRCGQSLEACRGIAHALQQPGPQPSAPRGEDDMLDASILGTQAARDEPSRLEAVDDPSDVRAIAGEPGCERVHRQWRGELQERARLCGVKVKLGGSDEKSPPMESKERAKQLPCFGAGRFGIQSRRAHRHSLHRGSILLSISIFDNLNHLLQCRP